MFRGETFYEAAVRKVCEETGNEAAKVNTKGVCHVWNTYFPDSNWDAGRKPGREGSQTVNIVVVCECADLVMDTAATSNWAVSNYRWVSPEDCISTGQYDRYVSLNVIAAIKSGLISTHM